MQVYGNFSDFTHAGSTTQVWPKCEVLTTLPLKFRASRTTIKNLRLQIGGKIIHVTFGKFVTSLVQQLKKEIWINWVVVSTLLHNFCNLIFS